MKTAFVTGATGFLGINVVKKLKKAGWNITTYSLPNSNYTYLDEFDVHNIEGDLIHLNSLIDAMPENVDCIFHIAGNTSMWSKNDKKQYQDNVIGTRNVIEAALKNRAKKLVYTSSISAYGYHLTPIDESIESNAPSCKMNYNITKFQAEYEVKNAVQRGLYSVILNPINIIGPYDISNWTKQFIKPIYNDNLIAIPPGRAMWCHVDDVAEAHINAYKYGRNGENYLLGGVDAKFLDVVQEVQKHLGKKRSYTAQPKLLFFIATILLTIKGMIDHREPLLTYSKYKRAVGNITCNYNKAKKELRFNTTSLKKMIADSCHWLQQEDLL